MLDGPKRRYKALENLHSLYINPNSTTRKAMTKNKQKACKRLPTAAAAANLVEAGEVPYILAGRGRV